MLTASPAFPGAMPAPPPPRNAVLVTVLSAGHMLTGACDPMLRPFTSVLLHFAPLFLQACIGAASCEIECGHNNPACCTDGKGSCCGCAFMDGAGKPVIPFVSLPDPCPGAKKQQAYAWACNNSVPTANTSTTLVGLKVNSLPDPITIDDPAPHFSWVVNNPDRGVTVDGYELEVRNRLTGESVWSTGKVVSNGTTYIPWGGAAAALVSDTVYDWVRVDHGHYGTAFPQLCRVVTSDCLALFEARR